MRRSAGLILLLAMFALVTPAQAGLVWCKGDPIVTLNGTLLDISIGIPAEYVLLVNGPVEYEIQTPPGVARQLILADVGYGRGVKVKFADGAGAVEANAFPVTIDVFIPINKARLAPDKEVPTELTVLPANAAPVTVTGTSDETTMKLSVQGR